MVNFDCIFLFPLFRLVSWNLIHLRYIRFSQNWLGSLAKRRLCLGPAGVINCTPLSALSCMATTVCVWVWVCVWVGVGVCGWVCVMCVMCSYVDIWVGRESEEWVVGRESEEWVVTSHSC